MTWARIKLACVPATLPVFVEWRPECLACEHHRVTRDSHKCLVDDPEGRVREKAVVGRSCSACRLDGPCGPSAALFKPREADR